MTKFRSILLLLANSHEESIDSTPLTDTSMGIGQRTHGCFIIVSSNNELNLQDLPCSKRPTPSNDIHLRSIVFPNVVDGQ